MMKINLQILFVLSGMISSSIVNAGMRDWMHEPTYEVKKEYIQPISEKDQLCISKCEIERLRCNAVNNENTEVCEDAAGVVEDAGKISANGDPISMAIGLAGLVAGTVGGVKCLVVEDCAGPYDVCFTSCNGTIKEEKKCASNCEIDAVLNSFKKIDSEEEIVINIIKKYLEGQDDIYITPSLSFTQIHGYLEGMSSLAEEDDVLLALIDNTLFGGASEGLAIFKNYFIYKKGSQDPIKIYYRSIQNEVVQKLTETEKGKKAEPYLLVNEHEIYLLGKDEYRFAQFLNFMRGV